MAKSKHYNYPVTMMATTGIAMAKSKHYNYPVTMMATTGHIRSSDAQKIKFK